MKIKTLKVSSLALGLALAGVLLLPSQSLRAHCQIPCGIYDDHARVQSMLEDARTVAKSVELINELADAKDAQSRNQLSRWVVNKEAHAQKVIATVCDYFLTQRVKPSQEDYEERLVRHHAIIIAAMKAKQNADAAHAQALLDSIGAVAAYYPGHRH